MNKTRLAFLGLSFAACLLSGVAAPVGAMEPAPAESAREIVGMRRLTEGEYRRSIADIFGPDVKVQGRFEPDVRRDGLIAIGSGSASISASGMEQYYATARTISAQVTAPQGRAKYIACRPAVANGPDDSCARAVLSKYGRLLYRRALDPQEQGELVAVAHKVAVESRNFYAGLEETLTLMLSSPEFLFRIERAAAIAKDGSGRLDDYSRASRLSFLFWDAPPDDALLQAVEAGELSTKEGLAQAVDRLAASPRLRDGLSAFFEDMLQFDLFRSQTKDTAKYPKFSQVVVEQAKQQTLRTVLDLLVAKNGDYRDIFTTRDTFMTRNLALVYRVPYGAKEEWSPYTFPAESERTGVLSQVSFLSLFAHPATSSPTKRGVAMNEIFLCQPVPQPPPNVDFSAINREGPDRPKTVRLRLEQHRSDPTCAGCHALFDPLGVSLERFDALGQARMLEDGAPIDVKSEFDGAKFEGARGLGKVMHGNPATATCLVRNIYATAVGRAPEESDEAVLKRFNKAFRGGGYRVPALMKAMARSDAFFTFRQAPDANLPKKVASVETSR